MRKFVLIVSRSFPATHKRKGQETLFGQKLLNGILKQSLIGNSPVIPILGIPENSFKFHTIRSNYPFWEKRIKQIQEGKAILSIRYWKKPGGCYVKGNTQIEVCQLGKDSGIGIQELWFDQNSILLPACHHFIDIGELCKNDGLSFPDFKDWFRKYDLSEPMAIIHFTSFRY